MKSLSLVFLTTFFLLIACEKDKAVDSNPGTKDPQEENNSKDDVLKVKTGWKIDTLYTGCILYSMYGYDATTIASQSVNVLEVDITDTKYDLVFKGGTRDSLSNIAAAVPNAVAAINGTYGEAIDGGRVSFFKALENIVYRITIPSDHLRFWKHEGAFYYNNLNRKTGIEYGNNALYESWTYPNIISGSPVLINNYIPVGENFVNPNANLNNLDGEHKDKHQGVRHPRTAIAITENNKVLLFTIDGRRTQTSGMTAKELTQFIKKNFDPKYALNLDGGGSTTMWIKGSKLSATGVINYPTDDGKFNHYGQRLLNNSIVVSRKN